MCNIEKAYQSICPVCQEITVDRFELIGFLDVDLFRGKVHKLRNIVPKQDDHQIGWCPNRTISKNHLLVNPA